MTDQQIFVYVDLGNTPHLVGRLWLRVRNRTESATFQYDSAWLQSPERFALEPALQMDAAPYHTAAGKRLFGAMGDSAPDRWGRALMMRAEARRERKAGEPQRTLWESDYLLSTLIDEQNGDASLELALSVAEYFRLSPTQARKTAYEVGSAVSRWREEATTLGIAAAEMNTVASAFEHQDLTEALRLKSPNR